MLESREILKSNNLKITSNRLEIIQFFVKNKRALSHSEIEKSLQSNMDRVTIYRNLKSFEEKGIIHQFVDLNGIQRFALCQDNCDNHQHQDQHIHLQCSKCDQTYCLDVHIPDLNIPENFQITQVEFMVKGICENCQKK